MPSKKVTPPAPKPQTPAAKAAAFTDAVTRLLLAWEELDGWIRSPNPTLTGPTLLGVDRTLLDDVRRAADTVYGFDPTDIAGVEEAISDAVYEAREEVASYAADVMDDIAREVETEAIDVDTLAAKIRHGADRVRAVPHGGVR
jgi:hypothetical protein